MTMNSLEEISKGDTIALDFETSALSTRSNMVLFSAATRIGRKMVSGAFDGCDFRGFWEQNKDKKIVFHNSRFDLGVMRHAGYDIDSVKF